MEWEAIHTVEDFLAWISSTRDTPYRRSLEQARHKVGAVDLVATARRTGAVYRSLDDGGDAFIVPFLGREYVLRHPGWTIVEAETGEEPSVYRQIILLHYLKTVDDDFVPAGFVSFGALPHARPYEHALQKAALEPLARAYTDNLNHLRLAAQALSGRPLEMEDGKSIAFSFWPLPRLPMGVALTPGCWWT